jgi:hypothetical protein
MTTAYIVVQPYGGQIIDHVSILAPVVSRHRTLAGAEAAIDREMRRLRRSHSYEGHCACWLDREIVETRDGRPVRVVSMGR